MHVLLTCTAGRGSLASAPGVPWYVCQEIWAGAAQLSADQRAVITLRERNGCLAHLILGKEVVSRHQAL